MYQIKARYYADPDNFGESYVITSDNVDVDKKYEIGEMVIVLPGDTVSYRTSKAKESDNSSALPVQQLKAEIAALIPYLEPYQGIGIICATIIKLRQLSAV